MKRLYMVGTSFETKGGISSVVNVYRAAGLFERFRVVYIATHADASVIGKARIAFWAVIRYWFALLLGRPGALHAHVSSRSSFWRKCLFMVPSFICGVPVILHLHGSDFRVFYEQESSPLRQRIIRAVFSRSYVVVVLSETWKAWVVSALGCAKVEVMYNPVLLPAVRAEQDLSEPSRVLFLGRLGQRKGTYDLLQAARLLIPRNPGVEFLLGGDGEVAAVTKHAEELGIASHIKCLGWILGEDKEKLLRSATMFVLPSYAEGQPMGVLEAMAYGLPIVATSVGGIPEAVGDDEAGFIITPGDIPALADRIEKLLGDADLRRLKGLSARSRVERLFSSTIVLDRIEAIYRRLGAPGFQ